MGKYIIGFIRIVVGGLFIFSGIIKANDTMGFAYKLQEYFNVFGMESLEPAARFLSIFFCVLEIILGIGLLIGLWPNLISVLLLLLILFFSFLTFYSAWFQVVTDCGCFGDFLKLTPWESFYKNLALLILIVILFANRKKIIPVFSTSNTYRIAFTALGLAILFPLYTYIYLPVWDFRPYKTGNDIQQLMTIPEDAPKDEYKITFTYKNTNTGDTREFDMNNLPRGDQWEFVDRKSKLVNKGYEPPIHDFSISHPDGSDMTHEFLRKQKGFRLLVVQYDLNQSNTGAQKKVNQLAKKTTETPGLNFWALTSSPKSKIQEYREQYNVDYPFYFTDATTLKTIIRSNPGLLLMKNNKILDKWPSSNLPNIDEIRSYMEEK